MYTKVFGLFIVLGIAFSGDAIPLQEDKYILLLKKQFPLYAKQPDEQEKLEKIKQIQEYVKKKEEQKKIEEAKRIEEQKRQEEYNLFARLVEAEAKGESYKGKVAVAEVVLNRVESEQFPDTITEVIYQKGQFSPVSNGSINNNPSEDSKKAVQEALKGTNLTYGALYFWYPEISTSRWLETRQTTVKIGVHEFKR
jgi:N-acetylmuramoyl-L-alanine amidase